MLYDDKALLIDLNQSPPDCPQVHSQVESSSNQDLLKRLPVPPLILMAYWRSRAQCPACILLQHTPLCGKVELDCCANDNELWRQDWKGLPRKVPISCHSRMSYSLPNTSLPKRTSSLRLRKRSSGLPSAVVTRQRHRCSSSPQYSAAVLLLPPTYLAFLLKLRVERK